MNLKALYTEPLILPSILSADFARLGEAVDEVVAAGARAIHFDVMDGHFVPPITIGPVVLSSLRDRFPREQLAIDVHLMVERPERHVQEFASAGADSIALHVEATPNVDFALQAIREAGCLAGATINPATPVSALAAVGERADYALCMSVNPGWGGQPFIRQSFTKLAQMRELLPEDVPIEVDGGIDSKTAAEARAAGANLFVAGSAIFRSPDPAATYTELASLVA